MKDGTKKLLCADDLALVANDKQEVQETMEEWNGLFTRHGLKLNLDKTDVLHIDQRREELDIELEGKKLTQRESSVYLYRVQCVETGTSKSTEICEEGRRGGLLDEEGKRQRRVEKTIR